MPHQIVQAQPPLEFLPPALDPLVVKVVDSLLPLWLRSRTNITEIKATNVETLVDFYHQFQSGKIRFLMAFRHPSANDPFCLGYLLSQLVPKSAKRHKIKLQELIHAHFIYDRGIPLWAGEWVGWLYPRLGGIPIQRGKVDRAGLRAVRELFADGKFPMLAAPEGATNGHNEVVSPLEPGIAQMGFWCKEDLVKANRSEQVYILPIGIQYRYVEPPWKALEKLLTQLEIDCGLPTLNIKTAIKTSHTEIYQRLYRLGEHLLFLMESFYTRFYHQNLSSTPEKNLESGDKLPLSNQEFKARLDALLNAALTVAEQYFNLQPHGSVIDRCRRLEQAGWDLIYREDLKNIEAISPLEKGLADRIAEEASLRMWHMRLVESFVAVTAAYVLEKPTADRFAETTLLMWDTITKIKGGNSFMRPNLGKQWAQVTVGQPLSVSERWETYQSSRRNAKQAVADLTKDLQVALESMIT